MVSTTKKSGFQNSEVPTLYWFLSISKVVSKTLTTLTTIIFSYKKNGFYYFSWQIMVFSNEKWGFQNYDIAFEDAKYGL